MPEVPPPRSWSARWAFPILVVGVAWTALSPIFVRLSEIGPMATGANRMLGALPVYLILMAIRPPPPLRTQPDRWRIFGFIAASGALFAMDVVAWNHSVLMTSIANSTLLANLTPIFVALASWLFLGEQVRRNFAVGMAVALTGSVVMMAQSWTMSSRGFTGDSLAVAASMFYSGYVLTTAIARRRASTITTMAVSCMVSALILVVVAVATEDQLWPTTTRGWLAIAGMILLVQIGGQTLITISLAHVSANLTALMFLIQPVIPTFVAWLLFGESITPAQVIGAAFVLAGLEIARRAARIR